MPSYLTGAAEPVSSIQYQRRESTPLGSNEHPSSCPGQTPFRVYRLLTLATLPGSVDGGVHGADESGMLWLPKSAIRGGMVASAANAGFDLESFDTADGPRWSKMTSLTTRRGVGIPQMVVVRGQSVAAPGKLEVSANHHRITCSCSARGEHVAVCLALGADPYLPSRYIENFLRAFKQFACKIPRG